MKEVVLEVLGMILLYLWLRDSRITIEKKD
jgi:hypothetical protein